MSVWRLRVLALLAALSPAAALVAPAGLAQGSYFTLRLQGGYANHRAASCGIRTGWTSYRVGNRLRYVGAISPAPAVSSKVLVVVRRCYGRHFQIVSREMVKVTGGRFRGSFTVGEPSDCFVQAQYRTLKSNKAYFRVR